ncbi:MAG: cyclase family protein [Anaerolineae bacterium]
MRIYDVSVPITEVMPVWPGDPRVRIEKVASLAKGDEANLTHLQMSCHTGTHVDAPYHFDMRGLTVDKLDPELLIGPAFVAEVDRLEGNRIQVYDLASLHLPKSVTRLLLKTTNSYFWEDRQIEFERDYVCLDSQSAAWIVRRGIQLVGIDYLSVEAFQTSDHQVHKILLGSGVVIVEGLDLSRVPAGPCQLVCLPLKIEGGDGAPARVLVIRD